MANVKFIHPGEHLEQFLDEYGISQNQFAKTIGVPPSRVNRIVNRRSPITADMALRIGRAFYIGPEFWLNLQQMYDLDVARASTDVSAIQPLVPNPEDDPEFRAILAAANATEPADAANAAEPTPSAQSQTTAVAQTQAPATAASV